MEEVSFVDTSAWYAAYVPTDSSHRAVSLHLRSDETPFFTSDFVVDETITLMLARGERRRAVKFGRDLLIAGIVRMEIITVADLVDAYQVFAKYVDKKWSFTDCTSYVLMRRVGVTEALTLDKHFRQMPGISVVPRQA